MVKKAAFKLPNIPWVSEVWTLHSALSLTVIQSISVWLIILFDKSCFGDTFAIIGISFSFLLRIYESYCEPGSSHHSSYDNVYPYSSRLSTMTDVISVTRCSSCSPGRRVWHCSAKRRAHCVPPFRSQSMGCRGPGCCVTIVGTDTHTWLPSNGNISNGSQPIWPLPWGSTEEDQGCRESRPGGPGERTVASRDQGNEALRKAFTAVGE